MLKDLVLLRLLSSIKPTASTSIVGNGIMTVPWSLSGTTPADHITTLTNILLKKSN